VSVNTNPLIHYAFVLIFCLGGFHGIFFHGNLVKKTASWLAFQMGLIVFLFHLAPSGAPLPPALAMEVAAVALVVTVLLGVLCLRLRGRFKTLDGDLIARRVFK
jgi:hypothetical protein